MDPAPDRTPGSTPQSSKPVVSQSLQPPWRGSPRSKFFVFSIICLCRPSSDDTLVLLLPPPPPPPPPPPAAAAAAVAAWDTPTTDTPRAQTPSSSGDSRLPLDLQTLVDEASAEAPGEFGTALAIFLILPQMAPFSLRRCSHARTHHPKCACTHYASSRLKFVKSWQSIVAEAGRI
jgi:hypothetical protein